MDGQTYGDLCVFGNSLLVLVLVRRRLEDLDIVMGDVREDATLEVGDLVVGEGVGLGNDGNEVDFLVETAHKLNVDLLETGSGSAKGWWA